MAAKVYILDSAPAPWGDYGSILLHGMSMHLARQDGLIQLERTGPFMPPITFPSGENVVKAWLRERLLSSGLTGFSFAPVIKRHIARLDWHLWDRAAEEPQEHPESGEPEDYILSRPHSEQASRMIADVFELVPQEVATIDRTSGFRIVPDSWGSADIFFGRGARVTFVSDHAREWLTSTVGEHVAFKPAQVA